ncbi:gibberellin 2-beta-dioxygenase 1 [Dendrobium catenatum]|uniref:gibberellin 2beta-dioxygenase n=1 Tax=Dendrobium catenatum TaxID=906689 RepID=A0A2I0XE24_9ASPA|nr:gibberellin 2-beta-dioxygenase 1 [Dendrobium catenatum]PKU86168.1 Gibberellin 2-beta-dioxygenase 1 [Dendrobium catenatum]
MVVITKLSAVEQLPITKLHRPVSGNFAGDVPLVDLTSPAAAAQVVAACEELGFFKLTNHGISFELIDRLECEAVKFFSLPIWKKDAAGSAAPFGYGSRKIGTWDFGWIEYLLMQANSINPALSSSFRSALSDYISTIKNLSCELLELMAEGLGLQPRNILSKLLMDEESDLMLRLNHYPPCPSSQQRNNISVTGFGEHTDPQVISILRSNNTSGLQISLRDGRWVPVPPDQSSFFVNVGDSLQVLTNGRFRSVKHRVLANSVQSRLSMIFFGGPPLKERVAPLPLLMEEGEESLYREFTWCEYKTTAYKTKLVDNRLGLFEKN